MENQETQVVENQTEEVVENPFQEELESFGLGKSTQDIIDEQKAQTEQPNAEEATEQSKPDADSGKTETPESEETAPASLSIEQITEIYGEDVDADKLKEFKKAYDNRQEWEKKLSQKAQGLSYLENIKPDQQDILFARLAPFVAQQEQLPETPDDLLEDAVKHVADLLPENLTHEDEDGYAVKVPREKLLPHVQKVIGAVLKQYMPELGVLRSNYSENQATVNKYQEQIQEMQRANGMLILDSFFAKNPQQAPSTVNDDETHVDALIRIENAGVDHPEYDKYLRFQAAGDLAKKSLETDKPLTFEKAWEKLYGKTERVKQQEAAAKKAIVEAQAQATSETPGKTIQPSKDEEALKRVKPSRADIVQEFFN